MIQDDIAQLAELIKSAKNIVITTHRNPDADAMGSSLALAIFLEKLKKKVKVITPNQVPDYLMWLPEVASYINFEKKTKTAVRKVEEADLIFCLDFNTLKRIDKLGEEVGKAKAPKVLIDHHQEPEAFAAWTFSDTAECATSQMIYKVMIALGGEDKIGAKIATNLYTGIMTDTGGFRFSSTTSETYRIAAALIDKGANPTAIHESIFDTNSESRLHLLGHALRNKMRVLPDYRTAFISLSQKELKEYHFKKGDTEGFVNYALSIKNIVLAAFFVENDDMIKVSFRSKGSFDVNKLAREHFNGGGHINASGGNTDENLEDTVKRFVSLLPDYYEEINQIPKNV